LVHSVKGFVRDFNRGNKVNNFIDGFSFVGEFSEQFVKGGNNTVPSGKFSGKVFFGFSEINLSLFSSGNGRLNV